MNKLAIASLALALAGAIAIPALTVLRKKAKPSERTTPRFPASLYRGLWESKMDIDMELGTSKDAECREKLVLAAYSLINRQNQALTRGS
jgi:hypothetical protein